MNSDRIYAGLPAWAQNLAVSAQGYRLKRRRYGRIYREYKQTLPEIYRMSEDEALRLQISRLRMLLMYAKKKSPFYADLYKGFDVASISHVEELKNLPVVDKETVRRNIERMYTLPTNETFASQTGGTTGKSLVVQTSKQDAQIRMAELDYFRESHGVEHGMRRASFNGKIFIYPKHEQSGVFWRTNSALKQRFYSSFHLSLRNIGYYVDNMNQFKPQFIDGFANCIADLCRFAKASGKSFNFRPIAIFPTSEPLYEDHRSIIREMLGVEPRDQYASSEGAPFLFECTNGNFHYAIHTGVIESDLNGEALVTSFTTLGTPLIRYKIGDRIVFSQRRCECGWDTPLVEYVEGRSNDYLVSSQRGKVYSANFSNVTKVFPNSIIQAQFVQEKLDKVTVRIVADRDKYDAGEGQRIITNEVQKRLGDQVSVEVLVVDEIPRAESGKIPFIVNELV